MKEYKINDLMKLYEDYSKSYKRSEEELHNDDKNVIYNNFEDMLKYINSATEDGKVSDAQAFEMAFKAVKADDYIEVLFPDLRNASLEEKDAIKKERLFIFRNIQDIEIECLTIKKEFTVQGKEYTNQEVVRLAVDNMKNKREAGVITASDIENDMKKGKFDPEKLTRITELEISGEEKTEEER